MNLGKTIRELRKEKGIKQNILAKSCAIEQSYLSNIESNRKEPSITTLRKISKALNIPLPIIFFLSMDEGDVTYENLNKYKIVVPLMKHNLKTIFLNH